MEKLELLRIVASLYAGLPGISDYDVPPQLPEVHALPRAILQDLVCARACQIRAAYHPDFGVMIDESLNLKGSLYDRSILLHELVHHAQHRKGKFDELRTPCVRRAAAEEEAYLMQNRYISANGGSEGVSVVNWFTRCEHQPANEESIPAVD